MAILPLSTAFQRRPRGARRTRNRGGMTCALLALSLLAAMCSRFGVVAVSPEHFYRTQTGTNGNLVSSGQLPAKSAAFANSEEVATYEEVPEEQVSASSVADQLADGEENEEEEATQGDESRVPQGAMNDEATDHELEETPAAEGPHELEETPAEPVSDEDDGAESDDQSDESNVETSVVEAESDNTNERVASILSDLAPAKEDTPPRPRRRSRGAAAGARVNHHEATSAEEHHGRRRRGHRHHLDDEEEHDEHDDAHDDAHEDAHEDEFEGAGDGDDGELLPSDAVRRAHHRHHQHALEIPVASRDICLECVSACPAHCKERFRQERMQREQERQERLEAKMEVARARRSERRDRAASGLPSLSYERRKEREAFDEKVESLKHQMGTMRAFGENIKGEVDTNAVKKTASGYSKGYDDNHVWKSMRESAPKGKAGYFETVDILRRSTPGMNVATHLRHHSTDTKTGEHPDVSIDPNLKVNLNSVPRNKRGYFKMVNMANAGRTEKIERYMDLEKRAHSKGWQAGRR
ncbi:hypothetical protein RI054_09g49390 [Pseudoscourfieldia marina]